jgi:energy-coupling factor transporter ATP-binding protein EcfA2
VIEARQLTTRYGEKTAVNELTFTVKPGVVTGFLGPNGAGKSTTIRMITGPGRARRPARSPSTDAASGTAARSRGRRTLGDRAEAVLPDRPGEPVPTVPQRLSRLTDREVDVLPELAADGSNAEIAERLFVLERPRRRVGRVPGTLGPRDRVQAVVFAYQTGLVPPG